MVSTRIPKLEQQKQQQQPIQSQIDTQIQPQVAQPLRLLQPPIQTMAHPPNFQLHFNPPEKLKAQPRNMIISKPAPIKRRRRKSRRQRKTTRNRSPHERVLEWADKIPTNHRSSGEGGELLENANNIAFAISLRKSAHVFNNNSKHLNRTAPQIDATKLTNSTDVSSTTIKFSNSTQNAPGVDEARINHRKEKLEHRNEVRWNDTVTYSVTSSITTNKYNIDYDNRLEDDFEIIEKDE